MISALQKIREGDGTAIDNTVIVYMGDKGARPFSEFRLA
jgi:hypothetical protein